MEATDLQRLEIPTFGKTIRAMTAEVDGVPVAAAGVIHTDPYYAFMTMTDEMRKHPKEIVKVIQGFNDWLSEYYTTVYAVASVEESNAPAVLERVGFRYHMTTTQGDIYQWHRSQFH